MKETEICKMIRIINSPKSSNKLSISASDISSAHSLDGLGKKKQKQKTQTLLNDKEVDGWNRRKVGFYATDYFWITTAVFSDFRFLNL